MRVEDNTNCDISIPYNYGLNKDKAGNGLNPEIVIKGNRDCNITILPENFVSNNVRKHDRILRSCVKKPTQPAKNILENVIIFVQTLSNNWIYQNICLIITLRTLYNDGQSLLLLVFFIYGKFF